VFFQFHVAMPLDMRAHGIDTATYGILVAINGALIVVVQPFVGAVLGRASRANVLAIAEHLGNPALWAGCFVLGLLAALWHRTRSGELRAPLTASMAVANGSAPS